MTIVALCIATIIMVGLGVTFLISSYQLVLLCYAASGKFEWEVFIPVGIGLGLIWIGVRIAPISVTFNVT